MAGMNRSFVVTGAGRGVGRASSNSDRDGHGVVALAWTRPASGG